LDDLDEFGGEPDVGTVVASGREDDRLEEVLGDVAHLRRARGGVVPGPVRPGAPGLEAGDLLVGETGRPNVVAHEFVRGRHGPYVAFDPQIAEYLDGALIGDVRPRGMGGTGVAGDRDRSCPGSGQQR
jgi:hypothetical protein